jgi:hypothetical protein
LHPYGNSNAELATNCITGVPCTYSATGRTLFINKGPLTLCTPGNTCAYNLCNITVANSSSSGIKIAADRTNADGSKTLTKVLIFLDVPFSSTGVNGSVDRPTQANGGCPSNTPSPKSLDMASGAALGNTGLAKQLQIYAYGYDRSCGDLAGAINQLVLNASSPANVLVWAPRSYVNMNANSSITGAVLACQINVNSGASFTYDASANDSQTLATLGVGLYTRSSTGGWRECKSTLTGSSC